MGSGEVPSTPTGTLTIPLPLLAGAIVLWGLQNDLLQVAVPMASILLAARWVSWRWDLSGADFNRLADVTGIAFIIVGLYQFDALAARGIYGVLRWTPALLFPLLACQVYSTRSRISYSALFISVRRALSKGTLSESGAVDFRNPYFVLCLVASGGAQVDASVFLPAVAALVLLVLWTNRPPGHGRAIVALVAALGVGGAFLASEGIITARRAIEPMLMEYFQDRIRAHRDPYRAYTAMGSVGRLKLSERIVLRVTPSPGQPVPTLLREAVYQSFASNAWVGGGGDFTALPATADGTAWNIDRPGDVFRRITIAQYMVRGKGLIPLPMGTFRIDELPVEDLWRNRLGTLKVMRGPDLVEYHARYRADDSGMTAPRAADLRIPPDLRQLTDRLSGQIWREGSSPGDALQAIEAHFRKGFTYSLLLPGDRGHRDPLEEFLEHSRTGHCEFYATATVLLLRAAGIPARYATGYAVNEWSELEQQYVVRRRHAHAWATAFVDGAWRDVDTTPPVWAEFEAANEKWWTGSYDFLSWLAYRYARWRWLGVEESPIALLVWLGVPLVLYLGWRLSSSRRVQRCSAEEGQPAALEVAPLGTDSELLNGISVMDAAGLGPARGESLKEWSARLSRAEPAIAALRPRSDLMDLHYRHRFDPDGVSGDQRRRLARASRVWLDTLGAANLPESSDGKS